MAEKLYLSENGYDFLQTYTDILYNERGSFSHNLKRYKNSEEFQNSCRDARNIEVIPELTNELLFKQIDREVHFRLLSQDVKKHYDDKLNKNNLSDEDCYEIAGIMGLCPGRRDWHETLFPHLVDLFVSSEVEALEIHNSVEQNPKIVNVMVSNMMNGIREGQIINYKNRKMLSQGYARNYFRGENAYYGSSRPSQYRSRPSNDKEALIHDITGKIKTIEFGFWLQQIDFIKKWPYGDVFHAALAQHYGIPTNAIDITSNLEVALFFACCQFDRKKNAWRPLEKEEFEHKNSRADIAGLGGDSRYGLIFSAPTDILNMSFAAKIPHLRFVNVTPIGHQPFMRCSYQSGYVIEAGPTYDLYNDCTFAKYKFRHNSELTHWIFNKMDEGRLIYPFDDGLHENDQVIKGIRELKNYSKRSLEYACSNIYKNWKLNDLKVALDKNGHCCADYVEWCSSERIKELNQYLEKIDYCKRYGIVPDFRLMFSI